MTANGKVKLFSNYKFYFNKLPNILPAAESFILAKGICNFILKFTLILYTKWYS